MTSDKVIRYLIIAMAVFSVIFYWGAYAAGAIGFIIILAKKPRSTALSVTKQKPVIFLAAAVLLSTVFSKALGRSLFIDGIIILHFMAFSVLVTGTRLEDLGKLFRLLNLIAIFVCLYGIYQYMTGNMHIDESWTDTKNFGSLIRIYSTLGNPNMFAGYLAFNISYALAYLIQKKRDIYAILNIALSSICLIFTYSRGGFIALFAASVVIIILYRNWKAAVYLAFMSVLYYRYNMVGGLNRADIGILGTDSSSLYRLEIWKASIGLFLSNIAFGSGLGSVLQYLSYSSEKLKGLIYHSHNIYIHLLAETGVVGLTAFGYLVMTAFRKFKSFWREYKSSEYAYIAVGFAASMTAMLVHGLIDCVPFIPTRSLVFLTYLSLFPILVFNFKKPAV